MIIKTKYRKKGLKTKSYCLKFLSWKWYSSVIKLNWWCFLFVNICCFLQSHAKHLELIMKWSMCSDDNKKNSCRKIMNNNTYHFNAACKGFNNTLCTLLASPQVYGPIIPNINFSLYELVYLCIYFDIVQFLFDLYWQIFPNIIWAYLALSVIKYKCHKPCLYTNSVVSSRCWNAHIHN